MHDGASIPQPTGDWSQSRVVDAASRTSPFHLEAALNQETQRNDRLNLRQGQQGAMLGVAIQNC